MKITLRLVAGLVLAAALVVALSTYVQVRQERHRQVEELDRRAAILAETIAESAEPLLRRRNQAALSRLAAKYADRERLQGTAVADAGGRLLAVSRSVEELKEALEEAARETEALGVPVSRLKGPRHLYARPTDGGGAVVLVHDAAFIATRLKLVWKHNAARLFFHALLIVVVSLWIIHFNVAAPIEHLADWMKKVRAGEPMDKLPLPADLLAPVAQEAAQLAKSLSAARAAAEEEANLRQQSEAVWTPERLKAHVLAKLEGRPLVVVANREPYMHVRKGKKIEVITPASGLVTGVEPVLLACGGTWIAHGAGDADRETVDENNIVRVPPEEPKYDLRRVWITKEEEGGYYYGFSNEGLWPLCHIAHARPSFREEDWAHYQAVNRKFAEAVLEEIRGKKEPCVLIQDYHFAILPRLIKHARPDARVALFWHIPWPNPEAFGICPWQREILDGMLGADIIGFHIQYHCNNFLETVDRALESRIDWERFAVNRKGHTTSIKPFPISIAFPTATHAEPPPKATLLKEHGVKAELMAVGVDRIDYTKGIIERFLAVERFLEKNPDYVGKFCFVELGAPSRTHIKRYHDLMREVEAEAERINWKFKTKDYKPILLLAKHHSHAEIDPYYRAADVCLVTSLHDGMNLVAKEFVATREDLNGALILSRFTGAAREFRDALIVNPYDIEQTADALRYALEMDAEDKSRRMAGMRRALKENNVYRWAGRLIEDLAAVRLPTVRV